MGLPWDSPLKHEDRLLERARSGERAAFVRLYRSLYPPLWRFVARRTARREDAEDVVARLFETLLRRISTIDTQRGHVRTFLLGAARNVLIDSARSRREPLDLADVEPLLLEPGTPLDTLLSDERAESLRGQLAALPDDARLLLGLRYGDGLDHREIGALLQLSPPAVRQRLSRLVRNLRQSSPRYQGALNHEV